MRYDVVVWFDLSLRSRLFARLGNKYTRIDMFLAFRVLALWEEEREEKIMIFLF